MPIEDDAGLGALLAGGEVSVCCDGFTFTEGPVWVADDDCLLFSDIPNDRIYRWRPGSGTGGADVYRAPSRNSNGLTLDRAGRLLACEHSGRQVSAAPYDPGPAPDQAVTPLATRHEGYRLNSPNDIVVHSSGVMFFTDPTYGLRDAGISGEMSFRGVYRLERDGSLTPLDRTFSQPNGLALSPDERVLYVGDSEERLIRRFTLGAGGGLRGGELFVDMRGDPRPGVPDGMKVDEDGRLWTTGAGGIWVIAPDGTVLGVLPIPEKTANLCFGGPDFSTIFITAHTSVYMVETRVRGLGPGSRAGSRGA